MKLKEGDICPHCKKSKLEISKGCYNSLVGIIGVDKLCCENCDSTYIKEKNMKQYMVSYTVIVDSETELTEDEIKDSAEKIMGEIYIEPYIEDISEEIGVQS